MDEIDFGRDGLLYIRTLKYVARFDPDRMGTVAGAHAEVPFDYGEAIRHGGDGLRGVVKISWAMGGANGFSNGLDVAPDGTILCLADNYRNIREFMATATYMDANVRRGNEAMIAEGYRPRRYPGRIPGNGELVWRWSPKGELTGEDLVPGMQINSYGIRSDKDGNIYVGVGYHQMVDGKPHIGGAVVKFPPTGGKFSTSFGKPVPLKHAPKRPADFCNYRPSDKVWVDSAYWCYPGLDMAFYCDPISRSYPCHCANCRFDTDPYGRCFIPKSYAFTIGIIDTNGNRICEVGRYGNADSPAMKPGDTDIGLAQCSYLATVSDRWLYLNDDANVRIIRLKLGYHAEEAVPIR